MFMNCNTFMDMTSTFLELVKVNNLDLPLHINVFMKFSPFQ